MKKVSISVLLLCSFCIIQSCGDDKTTNTDTTTKDSTVVAKDSTVPAVDTGMKSTQGSPSGQQAAGNTSTAPVDQGTKDFVMKAASGGMMEVELGKVAQEKAKSQRVKDFGSMMVTDHTKANDELKSLASSKNITVPATMMPDEQKHVDMLKNKSGSDFDKSYMSMMLEDHIKDVGEFKKASHDLKDATIKGFAGTTLPVLQKHLDSAKAISKSKM